MHNTTVDILKDKSAPASALLAVVFEEYGADCFDWESEVLRIEIERDFGVVLEPEQSDKLQAAVIVISTDHFENDWHTFNCCIHALNGEPFSYDELYPVDAEQIAAAMPEIETIRNSYLEEGFEYSSEVNAYAGMIFSEYGLFFAPEEFPSAIMPSLPGEHNSDSQSEKRKALAELYTSKKAKIAEYLNSIRKIFDI